MDKFNLSKHSHHSLRILQYKILQQRLTCQIYQFETIKSKIKFQAIIGTFMHFKENKILKRV